METKKKLEFYGGTWVSFLPFIILYRHDYRHHLYVEIDIRRSPLGAGFSLRSSSRSFSLRTRGIMPMP